MSLPGRMKAVISNKLISQINTKMLKYWLENCVIPTSCTQISY